MNADAVTHCNPTKLLCGFHSRYKGCDIWRQYDPVHGRFMMHYWAKHDGTILHAKNLDGIKKRITLAVNGMTAVDAIYIREGAPAARVISVEDDLDRFKELIDCDCVDVVHRTIDDRSYIVVCDDVGLWKHRAVTGLGPEIHGSRRIAFVGSLLLFQEDGHGDFVDMDPLHILNVMNNMATINGQCVLTDVKSGRECR